MSPDERLVERVLYDLADHRPHGWVTAGALATTVCERARVGQDTPRRRVATDNYASMIAHHLDRLALGEPGGRAPRSQSQLLSGAEKARIKALATAATTRFHGLVRESGGRIGTSLAATTIRARVERPDEPLTRAPRARLSPLAAR